MKHFTQNLRWLLMSLLLVTGLGSAWGDEVTLAYTTNTTTNMTGNNDAATVGLSATNWSVVGAKGGNSNFPGLNKSGYIALYYNATASNTLTVSSLAGANINSITINYTGNSYNNGKVLVNGSEVTGSSGTYTINSSSFVVTNGNTSNVQVRISSIVINYTATSTPSIAFSNPTTSVEVGSTVTNTATVSNANGATISYSSDATSVATVNSSTGEVTGVAAGTATITASITVNGTTYTDSYQITVNEPFVITDGYFDFTQGEDYGSGFTSGQAGLHTGTWTAGYVTMDAAGRNAWYEATSFRLYAASGDVPAGNITFAVPSGYIITQIVFTGNNLNNMSAGVGSYSDGTWTGSANPVTFTASASTTILTATITYSQGSAKINTTLTFNPTSLEATLGQPVTAPVATLTDEGGSVITNPALTYTSSNTSVATVNETTGALELVGEGSTDITATFEGNETYNGTTGSYSLTVVQASTGGDTYVLVTDASTLEEGDECLIVYEEGNLALGAISDTSTKYGTGVNVTITDHTVTITNESVAILTLGKNGNYFTLKSSIDNKYLYWGSGNTLNSNANVSNNTSWTLSFNDNNLIMANVSDNSRILKYNTGSPRFACYTSGQQDVQLYKKQDSKTATSITFSENGPFDVELGTSFTAPTATLSPSEAGSLTYSSSNTNVATVNETTGEVAIVGAGTTTITVSFEGNDNYKASSKTYTITVTDPNANDGSAEHPYTVAEALAVIDGLVDGGQTENVYITGIIASITEVSTEYGNATYLISDDGTSTTILTIFRSHYLEDALYTSGDQIAVGDEVVLYGQLYKYVKNGVTTPELAQGGYLISLVHHDVVEVPAPVFSAADGTTFNSEYDIEITADQGLTIYFITQDNKIYKTATGMSATKSEASVDVNGNPILVSSAQMYSSPLTFSQSMMITAVAVDANGNQSDPVTVQYTHTGAVSTPYYSEFSASAGDFTITNVASGSEAAPEWHMGSNTGAAAIANWGEERYYMKVQGTEGNTNESRTRYYGTAYLTSPIIDLRGKTDASFSFIHAGHHFYADPNTSSTGTDSSKEMTLSDAKAKAACRVEVGISDASGNVTTWTDISDNVNYFTQKFNTNKVTTQPGSNDQVVSSSSVTSRSGSFPRANSGDISLASYAGEYIRIRFAYTSTSENYGTWNIDQVTVNASTTEKITMNAKGWTTYVIDHDIDAYTTTQNYVIDGEETLKIFKVTEFDHETCVLQQLGMNETGANDSERYLHSQTPIVIYGPAGQEINFKVYNPESELPLVKNNLLIASLSPNTAKAPVGSGIRYFVLQWNNTTNQPWFNKVKEGVSIPDHKAYLNGTDQVDAVTTQSNPVKGIYVLGEDWEDEATGIISLDENNTVLSKEWYTLQGVRIERPTSKGIYILNGKKVLVK